MKKGAIFDMDGLLFDTERIYQENWAKVIEIRGLTLDPAFPQALCGTSGDLMRQIIRRFYPSIDADDLIRDCFGRVNRHLETDVPEKPGVHEILDMLHRAGVRIAVASSSDLPMIEHNLEMTGIRSYFDAVVSGQQVEHGKPAPDIFLLAAERIGLPPQDCYVFEDGINGVRAGLAAGCATIMVPDRFPPTDELRRGGAQVYDSLLAARDAIECGAI